MKPAWLAAFTVAGTVTLAATPLLRRLALRIDLVDHPGPRKIHTAPVRYLGRVAIAFGALAGLAEAPAAGRQPGAIAAQAAATIGASTLLLASGPPAPHSLGGIMASGKAGAVS